MASPGHSGPPGRSGRGGAPGPAGDPGPGTGRDFGPGPVRDLGPDRAEDFDPGLARERTRLSWTRTAIAFAAVGAAVLKSHLVEGLIVLSLAGMVWGLRQLFRDSAVARSQPARLLAVTLTVVAVAIVALAIAFLGHQR